MHVEILQTLKHLTIIPSLEYILETYLFKRFEYSKNVNTRNVHYYYTTNMFLNESVQRGFVHKDLWTVG